MPKAGLNGEDHAEARLEARAANSRRGTHHLHVEDQGWESVITDCRQLRAGPSWSEPAGLEWILCGRARSLWLLRLCFGDSIVVAVRYTDVSGASALVRHA